MFLRIVDRVLQVKNVYFVYIILYMLSVASNPTPTSARHIADVTGNYDLVTVLCVCAAIAGLLGLLLSYHPIRLWICTSPFLFYCFIIAYVSLTSQDPKAWSTIFTFTLFMLLAVSITWEKLKVDAPNK